MHRPARVDGWGVDGLVPQDSEPAGSEVGIRSPFHPIPESLGRSSMANASPRIPRPSGGTTA